MPDRVASSGVGRGLAGHPEPVTAPGRNERSLVRWWTAAWAGAAVLGVANGVAREALYARRMGERSAEAVSTVTLVAALAAYAGGLERRWPLPSGSRARAIGVRWAGMTVAFEFAFGHFGAGASWGELAQAYDVRDGRPWVAVPLAMAVLPALVRRRG